MSDLNSDSPHPPQFMIPHLYAKEALSLKSGCNVSADLHFQRVQIELDAKFVGQCQLIEASEYDKVAAPLTAMLK